MLIPLTASLYVPSKLSDPEKVIVDVGTGYFMEKVRARARSQQTRAEARKMYDDKVAFVTKNMEQLQETIHRKQDNLRVVNELMQLVRRRAHPENAPPAKRAVRGQCIDPRRRRARRC